ncbi:VPS10 domain-containing receptor SorCS3 [Aix galericulata]|nr:VPS10 domain-containing receptor SorCS3 [Aix galericulata]
MLRGSERRQMAFGHVELLELLKRQRLAGKKVADWWRLSSDWGLDELQRLLLAHRRGGEGRRSELTCGMHEEAEKEKEETQMNFVVLLLWETVILILTKLYDFNLGSVTESSLWSMDPWMRKCEQQLAHQQADTLSGIGAQAQVESMDKGPKYTESSTDYGTTYEKLNDKVGLKTVLSYLYVSPTNKRKIMLLSDPEIESSILISSDEGATYQKYRLNFYIQSLLFHPKQEEWILAYSLDQKLYSSMDFGRKWQLMHERVTPNRFYWSVAGLDKEPDLVHMEARTADGHTHYLTCRIQECSETKRTGPFSRSIDISSLVVQDEYIFIQVTTSGRANYYVSYRREPFAQIKLPKYSLPKDMHIISTVENQVFAAVQEWNQNDTYNLYISDTRGVYFTLALENVKSSRGLEGNIIIDLYEVAGIKGIFLANKKIDDQIKTFITYNKGRDWRLLQAPATNLRGDPVVCQLIFEEEYNVWFLDWGGALVALKQTSVPIRHLWKEDTERTMPISLNQAKYDPKQERVFGHFSLRSEWQLVKVDYKSIFSRRCNKDDYQTWHLHNQGEPCVMGERKIYKKRKPGAQCSLGRDYSRTVVSEPDYGYERHSNNQCVPAFWFSPSSLSKDCSIGQSYLNSTGYRRIVSNNCTDGLREKYMAKVEKCPGKAPRGLHILTADGKLVTEQGQNATFIILMEEGDLQRTNIQLDFGDGIAVSYANFSPVEDGIRHVYKSAGIFQVTAYAENSLGSDTAVLFLHVVCPVEHVHLSVPFVAIRNKDVNITAVVWPSQAGTLTYFWWFGNNTKPLITLESSISYVFAVEGMNTVTVQVAAGNTLIQDTKEIAVHEYFQSQLLSFSPNLDYHNPDIPEWRQDIGKVIRRALAQVTGIPDEQILVAVFPGLPTSAELFILPRKNTTEMRKSSEADLEQVVEILFNALNQNLVQFELKPGVEVIVYVTQLTLAPLVDSSTGHSSSAMLMLLSVVFVGLAVFLIYKFKRKIPWINIYAQVQHDKEQEMIGSVSQSENAPKITLSEFTDPEELMDKELDTRVMVSSYTDSSMCWSEKTNQNSHIPSDDVGQLILFGALKLLHTCKPYCIPLKTNSLHQDLQIWDRIKNEIARKENVSNSSIFYMMRNTSQPGLSLQDVLCSGLRQWSLVAPLAPPIFLMGRTRPQCRTAARTKKALQQQQCNNTIYCYQILNSGKLKKKKKKKKKKEEIMEVLKEGDPCMDRSPSPVFWHGSPLTKQKVIPKFRAINYVNNFKTKSLGHFIRGNHHCFQRPPGEQEEFIKARELCNPSNTNSAEQKELLGELSASTIKKHQTQQCHFIPDLCMPGRRNIKKACVADLLLQPEDLLAQSPRKETN